MNPNVLLPIIGFMVPIFIAIGAYSIAKKKRRKPWLWFFNCLLTGFLGLIVICCSKSLSYDEELDYVEEKDVLGWIMFPLALIWFAITFYNSYYAVKSYNDAMIFDAMMQLMR
jgi:putative effector of murein hydrolase